MRPILRSLFASFVIVTVLFACGPSSQVSQSSAGKISSTDFRTALSRLSRPGGKILVVAHRGDWRNAPENSLPGLRYSIEMGADMMEIDLKQSKDGQLIIMHDKTIDRSTNGKGKPEDFTLEELKKFRLRNGLGRATENQIPTFGQLLDSSRGRILINVDKGVDYYPAVVKMLRERSMLDQAVINIDNNSTLDQLEAKHGAVPDDVWLMPIVDMSNKSRAHELIASYKRHRKTIYQINWSKDAFLDGEDLIALRDEGYGIWLNSLWPSLNGGHDDDRAVELGQKQETWGWIIDKGATIIQTDRPRELLQYLQVRGLR